MEWILVILAVFLSIHLSSSGRLKELRSRYAYILFLVAYPLFFYLVILPDITWLKVSLFLIMLASGVYTYFKHKVRLAANDVQHPS